MDNPSPGSFDRSHDGVTDHPVCLSASSPEDVLAAVPVVLGFEPQDSIVMLTFGGVENFHARLDLPPPAEADGVVALLLEPALRHRVDGVIFVVYGDDGPPARTVIGRLRRRFGRAGITVVEVLRVHQGRWFSPGSAQMPPHGVPFDLSDHRFRAQAVAEGIVVHRSRGELEALIGPRPDAVASVSAELERAVPSPPDELADLIHVRLGVGRFSTVELARVLLGLLHGPGRDAALAAMTREHASRHVQLWTDAVQRAPDEVAGPAAAVLALAAWLAGNGALGWCAVERCVAVDPGNSLAELVAELLTRAVPPSTWQASRMAG